MLKAVFCLFPVLAVAADPSGFTVWKASDLKSFQQKLSSKVDAQKVATQNLANYGNHLAMIAHREASGQAELHVTVADVFVVESGEGTVVVGGKIPSQKTTGPGEIRGGNIEGGSKHQVGAGEHAPSSFGRCGKADHLLRCEGRIEVSPSLRGYNRYCEVDECGRFGCFIGLRLRSRYQE
jgi:GTPase